MAERVTTVRLRAEIADLKRQMAEAGVAVKGVGDEAEKAGKRSNDALNKVSATAGLLGAAMVAAAGTAIKAFADFDQSMSNVQAATHESTENMAALRDAALEAGKRTVYSATESAGAIEELAKAGLSTADILNGGLNGALDLAAAGGLDVAEAAGIASVALKQFKLPGADAAHIADLLAAGAGKAMGSVQDLGMALKQGGQVAAATGLTIEETTAGLSAFASAGLLGSDAGTSFKTMLQRLTPQSDEAASLMKKLNVSAYDASGNFIGLATYAGKLQAGLKDLTPEARNAALATLFGSDAVRAANVLYSEGEKGIRDWTAAVNDQGYAAETARIRLDNLKGDFEQLSGSVETALIGLGESANGPLRELVQGVTNVVNAFADLPGAVQGGLLAIVGGGGLVLLGVAGLAKLAVAVSEVKAAMAALNISAKAASVATAAVGGVLILGTNLLTEWASAAAESKQNTDDFADTLDKATGAITAQTRMMAAQKVAQTDAARIYQNLGGDVSDLTGYLMGSADAMARVNTLLDEQPKESFAWLEFDNSGVGQVRADLTGLVGDLDASEEKWRLQASAMDGATTSAEAVSDATAEQQSALATLAEDMANGQSSTESYTDALKELIDAQLKAAGVVLDERDAQRQFQEAIDAASESLDKNGRNLDIGTEKGRQNQAALDAIGNSTWDLIDAMRENQSTQGELEAQMATSRQAFLDAAGAMGMSAEEASALADKLNLIPSQVSTQVLVDTAQAEDGLNRFIQLANNRSITVNVGTGVFRVNGTGVKGFAGGGWTGDGPTNEVAGPVHRREFVVKAGPASQYRGALEAINAGMPLRGVYGSDAPHQSSSADTERGGGVVTLDPVSVREVARALSRVQLALDGRNVSASIDERMGSGLR